MDVEPQVLYERPAIVEREPVIGLMGTSFSDCINNGVPENVCHELFP